jgi:hypothetical protein
LTFMMSAEVLDRPLPKPSDAAYVEARLLEALTEAKLALEFLGRGLVRNAAGKAFQAWKALLAALLRLELDKLKALARSEEERRWLESTAVPRVPTTRMFSLSLMLEGLGYRGLSVWTERALNIHDYQYHGPDPDMALSKYRSKEEAAGAIMALVAEAAERAEALRGRVKWADELERALEALRRSLSAASF